MSDARRAVLQALAYGDDPRITPGDRLRALDALGILDGNAPRGCLCSELDDDASLDTWDDCFTSDVVRVLLHDLDGRETENDPFPCRRYRWTCGGSSTQGASWSTS